MKPKAAESGAKAIKRYRGISVPLSGSMAPMTQKPQAKRFQRGDQQREQKSMDKGYHQEQLEALGPAPETRAFHRQFGFPVTISYFDLPAAGIGPDNTPGILGGDNRLIGEQVPGGAALAGTRNDQPERTVIVWVRHRASIDPCFTPTAAPIIPQGAMPPGAFATGNLPPLPDASGPGGRPACTPSASASQSVPGAE